MKNNSIEVKKIIGEGDSLANQIVDNWVQWDMARNGWKEKYAETIKYIFATSTNETDDIDNEESHEHTTHVPKLAQIRDNLVANIMYAVIPNENHFTFIASDSNSGMKEKTDAIEGYLITKNRVNGFKEKIEQLVDDFIASGNCFASVTYENKFTKISDTEYTTVYSGPVVNRIDPSSIVFSPFSDSFENSPKIIRTLLSLGELARMADENTEIGYQKEIISLISQERKTLKKHNADSYKSRQLQLDGFGLPSQYYSSGMVEILEFHGDIYSEEENKLYKNHVITVVDRRHVLRNSPSKTWTGKPHIYHAGYKKRPDNLWAASPLENLLGMQHQINHLENARADAFDLMLNPDKEFRGMPNDTVYNDDGSVHYFFDENGGVRDIVPDSTVLNADFQIQQKMNDMELFAGAPKIAMGIKQPGEQTAAEFNGLQNASSRFFLNKAGDFERLIEKLLNAELEVARRNLDTNDIIKVMDNDNGVEQFLNITKRDIEGRGTIVPKGVSHISRKNSLLQNLGAFEQAQAQDPEMRNHVSSIKKVEIYEELLGLDKYALVDKHSRIMEQGETAKITNIVQADVEESQVIQQQQLLDEAGVKEGAVEGTAEGTVEGSIEGEL